MVALRTVRARKKGGGKDIFRINADDFDDELWVKVSEFGEESSPHEEEPQAPFELQSANVSDAAIFIANLEDVAALRGLRDDEEKGKARKGVLAAIDAQLEALAEP